MLCYKNKSWRKSLKTCSLSFSSSCRCAGPLQMSASDLEDALSVGCDDSALEDVDGLAVLLSLSEDELELELESRRFFFFLLFLLKLKKVF